MAEIENSKDLISVLWSGADILRSKMDANEYKDYLLGIVFYKYLSDSFLIKVYDLLYDEKPATLKEALEAYKEALEDESAEELKDQLSEECHYVMEPELTYTYFADAARNNSFNREQLQKGFNNIEQSDPIFADLFTDIDLYSNRLGAGDQKQSDTVASLIKEIDKADLLNSDAEILGNAYEYLIGQFASETGKKKLLRSGNIYAVIGLPANLFYNTSIPTCIIVLKKHRDGRDVLFIDASKKFNKGKKQNEMTDEHIDEVLTLYSDRKTVEKESYLASFEDIEKNNFNLNIPRYVDNFEKEEDVDINTLLQDMMNRRKLEVTLNTSITSSLFTSESAKRRKP